MKDEDKKSYWSEGRQVCFIDDYGWGVSPCGETICVGKEADILDAWQNNKSFGNPLIDNILTSDINNRGKQETAPRATTRRHRIKNKRH